MSIRPMWFVLLALALTLALPGCKSEEEIEQDEVNADVKSLTNDIDLDNIAAGDFSQEMQTEFGRKLQNLFKEAQKTEADFVTSKSNWQPENYLTPEALADQKQRDVNRQSIVTMMAAINQYQIVTNAYWDKIHVTVKEQDGDDAPDPSWRLRFGLKAYVDAFVSLGNAHLAVIVFCDKHRPDVGENGLIDFEEKSDEYFAMADDISAAEVALDQAATVFEQMRAAQLAWAKESINN